MSNPNETRPFEVRPICCDDSDRLTSFYSGLSPDSRQARFHGAATGLGASAAGYFCGPDHLHREGLVAEAPGTDGQPVIIGHLCLEASGPGVAEMAIAVADSWQRHGVGRALLAAAIDWARQHGIEGLVASMQWGNPAILGLIRSTGCPIEFGPSDGGVVEALVKICGALPSAA